MIDSDEVARISKILRDSDFKIDANAYVLLRPLAVVPMCWAIALRTGTAYLSA